MSDSGAPQANPYSKLRLKPGMATYIYAVPDELREALALPGDVQDLAGGEFGLAGKANSSALAQSNFALTFAESQAEAVRRIGELEPALATAAVVWIGYPKGSKAAGYDLNRDTIWRAANEVGSVLNANVSIDAKWSAVRIRKAKPGEL